MGNCINHEAMLSWADEEGWEEWADPGRGGAGRGRRAAEEERQRLMGDAGSASSAPESTEVKIKVTKKQLQELLTSSDGGALPVPQLLARLVGGDGLHHAAHWRPALQSIPEAAES